MKKAGCFFSSMLGTILIILSIDHFINLVCMPKEIYELNSYISIENNTGTVINDKTIDYTDCSDENGNFVLKIMIGTYNERQVGFEISVLVNNLQTEFMLDGDSERKLSKVFYVSNSKDTFNIIIDRKKFKLYHNQLVINVRQDIDIHCYENNLLRTSNTENYKFDIVNKENKKLKVVNNFVYADNIQALDGKEGELNLHCINRKEDVLIEAKPREKVRMELVVRNSKNVKGYILWMFLNSCQTKMNGKEYLILDAQKDTMGRFQFDFIAPKKKGIYELEVFGIPSNFDENSDVKYEVLSANRYTIKVE